METAETQDREEITRPKTFSQKWVPTSILLGSVLVSVSIVWAAALVSSSIVSQKTAGQPSPAASEISFVPPASGPSLGNQEAKVTVVEYADFQCPFCKEFHDTVLPQLKKDFVEKGTVKFMFQNMPFLGQESFVAANAGVCAEEQGKFWEMHDLLYQNQQPENSGSLTPAVLLSWAKDLGLDMTKFKQCQESESTGQAVQKQLEAAMQNGVVSTPTIFIGSKKFEGVMPYQTYKTEIENLLK